MRCIREGCELDALPYSAYCGTHKPGGGIVARLEERLTEKIWKIDDVANAEPAQPEPAVEVTAPEDEY